MSNKIKNLLSDVKPYINLFIGPVTLSFGWFRGETTSLFNINILEMMESLDGSIDYVDVLSIKILKLCFSFGFEI